MKTTGKGLDAINTSGELITSTTNPINRPQLLNLNLTNNTLTNITTTQRIDSSISLNKNSLRLDFPSKTSDTLDMQQQQLTKLEQSQTIEQQQQQQQQSQQKSHTAKKTIKRNSSIISFKSLDFNLKSFCSSIKNKHGKDNGNNNSSNNSSSSKMITASSSKTSITNKAPYLKVETVDKDNDDDQLITFPHSPYSSHRSSLDKSNSQFLNAQPEYTRSQTNSPFLTITTPPNIRRSSTSDIIDKKPSTPLTATSDSRRPSTSDLLRRARERKGSESKSSSGMLSARMGRSASHSGLPRGGRAGRRTSMAF